MAVRHADRDILGIVLAGTHPWTSSAFDRLMPRPLLPVAHRPLISYALSWFDDGGVQTAAVCANRETRVLESRLHRDAPDGMEISYHQDRMPRGPAGAVRDAAAASDADLFVVTDGTSIPTVDLAAVLKAHRDSAAAITVVVHSECGRAGAGTVQVPTGIYVISRAALESVPASGFCDIKEGWIPQLHRSGARVSAYPVTNAGPRVLDAWSYLALNEWVVEHLGINHSAPDGYVKHGQSMIHQDAIVADDAVLVGPVLVGPDARILSGAVVVGPTSIGREASIGEGVLVSRSAVWRRCEVDEAAVIDRCILADDTIVPAGTQAFRQVHADQAEHAGEPVRRSPQPVEAPPMEVLRRMARSVLGSTLSRYPAAQ